MDDNGVRWKCEVLDADDGVWISVEGSTKLEASAKALRYVRKEIGGQLMTPLMTADGEFSPEYGLSWRFEEMYLETRVTYKCTVYDSNDDELFYVVGNDRVVVADVAANRARTQHSLQSVSWYFEKIYPERGRMAFQPPDLGERLETFVEDVSTIAKCF